MTQNVHETHEHLERLPLRSTDVRPSGIAGRTYVSKASSTFELGELETHIWRLCNGDHSVQSIATSIVEHFDVGLEVARRDLIQFLEDLFQAELIEWQEEKP